MNSILNIINESSKIALSFHTSPDGDAIGSTLGLYNALKSMGKDVQIVSKEEVPRTFTFLPGSEVITGENNIIDMDVDLLIVLDCGNVDRINTSSDINSRDYKVINIDHHISNDMYGDYNYVDPKAASVGEIIYFLLKEANFELTQDVGKCIYTSLLTDTGSFRYSNTSSKTHGVAAAIIDIGVDCPEIHRTIFDNKTYDRVKLMGKAIDNLELFSNGKIAITCLRARVFEDIGLDNTDTSDILNIPMKIGSVEVSAMLKESDNAVKISFRSKSYIDVRKISEHFDGGGHVRAAGAKTDLSIDQAKNKILKLLQDEFK